jgi:hypothetical protein
MGLLDKAAFKNTPGEDETDLEAFLEEFAAGNESFRGIVLEAKTETAKGLFTLASSMTAYTGTVRSLPGGNCLVLANAGVDRDLLAHRLAGTTKTRILFQFSADSVAGVLEELKSRL